MDVELVVMKADWTVEGMAVLKAGYLDIMKDTKMVA